ncbi:hypothetical protein [Methylocucumis oryzae]|uniref:COG4648 family protein n=1 Tax=Methylocucumis oryzae TaxID=1632867 RepID=UPI000697C468|nr:hypothetical protein [Methylocucumis oryzae]
MTLTAKLIKVCITVAVVLLYPYLVYQGMQHDMAWFAPTLFSGLCLYKAVRQPHSQTRISQALLALMLLFGAFFAQSLTAKALPIVIQLMLMVVFGRSLLKNQGPALIERFVRLQFPEYPVAVADYCWRLTAVWTGFFALNAVIILCLSVAGSDFWWAFYNGVMIYALIAVLAIGEYVFRRYYFSKRGIFVQGIPDIQTTIKTLFTTGHKVWQHR